MDLEYGVPDEEQRAQQTELLQHAFAIGPEHLATSFTWAGHENLRVMRRGTEALGCLSLVRMGQFFGGHSVPMVGIAGVATRPDAARQGVATGLMRAAMQELRAEGVALSALYASVQPLYRKCGFECAGTKHEAKVDPRTIELSSREFELRPATDADRPAVELFYREQAARRDGHLDRGVYIWNRTVLPRMGKDAHGVLVYDGERLEGYVYYRKSSSTPPFHEIAVTDLQARSPRGYVRLWAFLRDLSTSVVDAVRFSTAPNDPAFLVHPHQYFSLEMVFPWLLRVVDPVAALSARGYPRHVEAELHLALTDATLPENDGRYVLQVRDGAGTVERGGRGELEIDELGLASMYTGFAAPRDCGRGSGFDAAAAIFAGPAPWMSDHF